MEKLHEVSPPGWSGTVAAMIQKHGDEIDNPWALAWYMKKKGDKPHYKDQPEKDSQHPKKPEKKEKYKDEEKKSFKEWLKLRESKMCSCSCKNCRKGDCKNCSKDCPCSKVS